MTNSRKTQTLFQFIFGIDFFFQIFNSSVSKDKIWDIMTRLMDVYNHDVMYITPNAEEIRSGLEDRP